MLLSIITPTYNEALNIEKFINGIEKVIKIKNYEIIFVDDNSNDKTYDLIKHIAKSKKNIRCLRRIGRRGLSSAVIEGCLSSSSDLLLVMDADLQHPIALIKDLIDKFKTNKVDMVYTYKVNRETESALQRLFSKLFYYLINVNNRYHIPQNAGDFRIMSKSVVNAILKLPENERFMKGLYAWVGFRSMGISFEPEDRKYGKSFLQNNQSRAIYALGLMHEKGEGTKTNYNKAKSFYLKADNFGHEIARIRYDALEGNEDEAYALAIIYSE